MRIDRLDLIRYGKFTDHSVVLPAPSQGNDVTHDFHVIVGPNEAGKSTVRAAILDLLYGIPRQTTRGFAHPMSELRLGARLQHDDQSLDFLRIKANKATLRDSADRPLADSGLAHFLGQTDRTFFSQMFGLDHPQLVEGGHSLLSASDDLGQVLFQSAAGIGSLGSIRSELDDEADKLWSKRKSGERQYYIAASALDNANTALKRATVRAKEWSDAHARLADVDAALAELSRRHGAVRLRRSVLERVRRLTPHLALLDDTTATLTALGSPVPLPEDAARSLADASRVIQAAQVTIDHHAAAIEQARAALDTITVDTAVLSAGAEITALNEQRLQYLHHEEELSRGEAEIAAHWNVIVQLATGLGWDTSSESDVRAQLPSTATRITLARLLKSQGTLQQQVDATQRAEKAKRTELEHMRGDLAALPLLVVSPGLRAALATALSHGDVETTREGRRLAVARHQAAVQTALEALGTWRPDAASLRSMTVPDAEHIKQLTQERLTEAAQKRSLEMRERSLTRDIAHARLDIAQYQRAHTTVSRDDVLEARGVRDATWQQITADPSALPTLQGEYEQQRQVADTLVDQRHETVQVASDLVGKQALLERLELDLQTVQEELRGLALAGQDRSTRWATLAQTCGLSGLPIESALAWLAARAAYLVADAAFNHACQSLAELDRTQAQARSNLAAELKAQGVNTAGDTLAVLILRAQTHIATATDLHGQRSTLEKMLATAQRQLEPLAEDALQALKDLEAWQQAWTHTLTLAKLPSDMDTDRAEALLSAVAKIETALATIRTTQVERIDKMRADLDVYGRNAAALAGRVAPDIQDHSSAEIAIGLGRRHRLAEQANEEAGRQRNALEMAQRQHADSGLKRQQALAQLEALLQRAQVTSLEDLAVAIERSDRQRQLQETQVNTEQAIRAGGDSFGLEQLRAEAASIDRASIPLELSAMTAEDEDLVEQIAQHSAQRQAAATAVQAIAGTAEAAIAEAQRQEALSTMADAVDRYIKVYTASRMLRWSIDQYREIKQGPMLSAASQIFARLTLGSFDKLTVDFDTEPPKLLGRRSTGAVVTIDGMSEGTRDQLYLALRMAALDMHLVQAQVLPFIADDLFINFDDERSRAGLKALRELSAKTQVLFLTHHDHLLDTVREVFGQGVNVLRL